MINNINTNVIIFASALLLNIVSRVRCLFVLVLLFIVYFTQAQIHVEFSTKISKNVTIYQTGETQESYNAKYVDLYIQEGTLIANAEQIHIVGEKVKSKTLAAKPKIKDKGKIARQKKANIPKEATENNHKKAEFKTFPSQGRSKLAFYQQQITVVPVNHYQPRLLAVQQDKTFEIGNPLAGDTIPADKIIARKQSSPFFTQNFTRPPPALS